MLLLKNKLKALRQGYTLDQTLIVIILIAILITVIIATVAWSLINRASGTRIASQLNQIEDATGQFYSEHRMWPHQSITTVNERTVMAALMGAVTSNFTASVNVANVKNLLPSLSVSGTTAAAVNTANSFGTLTMMNNTPNAANTSISGGNQFLTVQMVNVPINEAQEADKAVDGTTLTPQTGRIVYGSTTCLNTTSGGAMANPTVATTGSVNLCFLGSLIQ